MSEDGRLLSIECILSGGPLDGHDHRHFGGDAPETLALPYTREAQAILGGPVTQEGMKRWQGMVLDATSAERVALYALQRVQPPYDDGTVCNMGTTAYYAFREDLAAKEYLQRLESDCP